ncbi:MAG: metal-dependent hydrolase [Actinobacteria bacterium]|nr:metal-dependent hydrolase [Actinomycetota bacterium]
MTTSTLPPIRRVRFAWPEEVDPRWTPNVPELALAANAVSLMMPHVEPYFVATVRAAAADIDDPDLAARARAYAAQEAQHHGQHRRYNDHLIAHYPGLRRVDRWFAALFRFMRTRSTRFGLAFAAGGESIAFIAARWVDANLGLFRNAEPTAATLFLWHLAEEVEHKEVAWDVYEGTGGGRVRYAFGVWAAALVLAACTFVGTVAMLRGDGRLFSPVAHLRLLRWTLSFVFVAVPVMVVSTLPGHHPSQLTDPAGFDHWLEQLDPATSTVPEWALP